MQLARVVGTVVATQKHPKFEGAKLLLVQPTTVDDQPRGVNLFAHASTCRALLPKIVRSYAIDAIERDAMRGAERTAASPDALRERATTLVDTSLRSPRQQFPSIGSGETWRLAGGHLSGGALTANGELLHLSAFVP